MTEQSGEPQLFARYTFNVTKDPAVQDKLADEDALHAAIDEAEGLVRSALPEGYHVKAEEAEEG